MYGLDANAFDDPPEFVEESLKMIEALSPFRSIIWSIFPILKKVFPNRFVSSGFSEWFRGLHLQAIELRRQNNISRDDYLNFLLELKERKNHSQTLMIANAFTFFLDGFETTSYMLGQAINLLAKNKDCQAKLRAELKSYDYTNFDDLNQMPYLDAVVNGIFCNY